MSDRNEPGLSLPGCVVEYIDHVIRRMRYSGSARREVRRELEDHFTDALAEVGDARSRQALAEQLIAEFGDARLLATLLRRAKKRNRPAWEKVIIRTFQGVLLVIVLLAVYTAWVVTGQPTIRTDYLAVLSERMRAKAPESDNAWPHYRQAMLSFVVPKAVTAPVTQQGESPKAAYEFWNYTDIDIVHAPAFIQEAIRKHLEDNRRAWQEYVAASKKPYCWFDYNDARALRRVFDEAEAIQQGQQVPASVGTEPEGRVWEGSTMMLSLPPLSTVRSLARIAVFRARQAVAAGRIHEALEDVLVVARTARHWHGRGMWVGLRLLGRDVGNLANEEIRRLAWEKGLTSADLLRVQEELDGLYPDGYPRFSAEEERIEFADTMQRLFTDGGPGGGHPIPDQLMYLRELTQMGGLFVDLTTGMVGDRTLLTAMAVLHAGRDETLAMANDYYDRVAEWSKLTPWQQRRAPNPDLMLEEMGRYQRVRYGVLVMLLPSLSRVSGVLYHGQCEYEATLCVLALERYHFDRGEYPAALDVLVKDGYLRSVPADPYSDGPIVYRRTDGSFTLYSVGGDFKDDGGVEESERLLSDLESNRVGDRVFWPVAPLKPFSMEDESMTGLVGGALP